MDIIARFISTCFSNDFVTLDVIRQNQFDCRILEGIFYFKETDLYTSIYENFHSKLRKVDFSSNVI